MFPTFIIQFIVVDTRFKQPLHHGDRGVVIAAISSVVERARMLDDCTVRNKDGGYCWARDYHNSLAKWVTRIGWKVIDGGNRC